MPTESRTRVEIHLPGDPIFLRIKQLLIGWRKNSLFRAVGQQRRHRLPVFSLPPDMVS